MEILLATGDYFNILCKLHCWDKFTSMNSQTVGPSMLTILSYFFLDSHCLKSCAGLHANIISCIFDTFLCFIPFLFQSVSLIIYFFPYNRLFVIPTNSNKPFVSYLCFSAIKDYMLKVIYEIKIKFSTEYVS